MILGCDVILALDPGKKIVGWAVFSPTYSGHGLMRVTSCGLLRAKTPTEMVAAARDLEDTLGGYLDAIVMECPQVYDRRHSKGDPNDLVDIAATGALVAGVFAGATEKTTIEFVRPHAWKGSVDGEVMLHRIRKRLDPNELALLDAVMPPSLRHNAVDAAGLGLWKVGRL